MNSNHKHLRREDLQRALERDMQRMARKESGHASFWRSLSVLGAVGWPIVLLTAGGAILGHWLDVRWDTGIRLTLMLLSVGAVGGGAIAWRTVEGTRK